MLLSAAQVNDNLEGDRVCNNAPSVNHLLFANDFLLLLKVDERSADHLPNILTLHKECLRQMIN